MDETIFGLPQLSDENLAELCAVALRGKARDAKERLLHIWREEGYPGPADAPALHKVLARAVVQTAISEVIAKNMAASLAELRLVATRGADEQRREIVFVLAPWDAQLGEDFEIVGVMGPKHREEFLRVMEADMKQNGIVMAVQTVTG